MLCRQNGEVGFLHLEGVQVENERVGRMVEQCGVAWVHNIYEVGSFVRCHLRAHFRKACMARFLHPYKSKQY
jgi:hypothetical protein